jgi:hypothetical protein
MSYYLLEQDLMIPGVAGIGGVPEDIEPLDWIQGKWLPPPRPDLRLTLSNTSGPYRGDIIGSLVMVFSSELKALLGRLGVDNVQYFPVELEDPRSKEVEGGYWLANVLGRVQCVARSALVERPSGLVELGPFAVDPARAALRLFRLHERPILLVVDQRLRDGLLAGDVLGVRLRETTAYDGLAGR